ncbi:hypothetical protein OB236_09460 [Paenibacillus sp. WQ 127069]|uniref:SMI1/KNR4 family protein n=1 Tax=Paenibacillus baimaensis TaxID=2982185 RepID=A0ABT2UFC4_9BACL|nr:hypothetical protein [Paenibacillus sp. WQ 127069]MCU6792354.1 hypothetical protein [Paenibacillus sp. WQ 127069]
MGIKLSNIHIPTRDIKEIIDSLQLILSMRNITSPNLQDLFGLEINPEFEAILKESSKSKYIFYLGQMRDDWISILNEGFGWGETEAFGEEISKHINSPVLTISYFDDDVLDLNIYMNGELITGHLSCTEGTKEGYGLEDKFGDISTLSQLVGHQYINDLLNFLEIKNSREALNEFERIINFPLWIKADWISTDFIDKDLQNKYVKYDFNK